VINNNDVHRGREIAERLNAEARAKAATAELTVDGYLPPAELRVDAKFRSADPFGVDGAEGTIDTPHWPDDENGQRADHLDPELPPEPPDDDAQGARGSSRSKTPPPVLAFDVVTLADVQPEKVSWLWRGWLPVGKLVTLDGDPGLGKSTLALTFAAIITTGGMWPDGDLCDHTGDVILLSAEDGLADTIRPGFDSAGGDPTKVHAVQGVPLSDDPDDGLRMPTLADIMQLRELITRTKARLVVVDVLMAYLPTGTDSHRDQDIRQVLGRLARLADDTGCTILLLRHLNKAKGGDPLYRGGGSIGIVGAARVGLLVAKDPDDDTVRPLPRMRLPHRHPRPQTPLPSKGLNHDQPPVRRRLQTSLRPHRPARPGRRPRHERDPR